MPLVNIVASATGRANQMSKKYTTGKDVPLDVLCKRLDELSDAVTRGKASIDREFYMRIPAEVDNDADLVIAEASRRLKQFGDSK